MDILAANDQENRVRNLQAGPAGKSLNAGLKGFNAKTPGNKAPKTPFKVPLNDENAVLKAGKSVLKTNGKGNENSLMTAKKGGKLDANAFVTPAGPRARAPLGMKTTNAKTNASQTPAPLSGKTQKASPRLRRPKVKVHQPEPQSESEDDVPDVEYMPPKEIPLPDDMEDYLPKDWKFPMFEGDNMSRGIWQAYHNPVGDDGRTRGDREFEETLAKDKKALEEEDRKFEQEMAKGDAEIRRYFRVVEPKQAAPKAALKGAPLKKQTTNISTVKARSAATALSPPAKPSYAVPAAATKSRLPTGLVSSKKPVKPAVEPSASRRAAATAASKSTIGYAQGRATTSGPATRKPLSNVTKPAPFSAARRPTTASSERNRGVSTSSVASKPRGGFSRCSSTSTNATLVTPPGEESYRTAEDVEREMELLLLQESDDEDMDTWANSFNSQLHNDSLGEEYEDFQLQLPEGF